MKYSMTVACLIVVFTSTAHCADSDSKSPLLVTIYLREASVPASASTTVVIEVENRGAGPILAHTPIGLEHATSSSPKKDGQAKATEQVRERTDEFSIVVRATVPAGTFKGIAYHAGPRKPTRHRIDPGKFELFKVEITAQFLATGECQLEAYTIAPDGNRTFSQPRTVVVKE